MEDKPKHYLFVCHANINRSKTAEQVCRKIAEQYGLEITVSSAGMSQASTNPVSKEMADKADVIFVMEGDMKIELEHRYKLSPGKIICLDIPDLYERDDPVLMKIVKDELYKHFKREGHVPNKSARSRNKTLI